MSKTIDNYKLIAEDYEAFNRKEDIFKQKAFFKKIIDRYSIKSCLDCACGAGWHLYMLNNMGINCFGSDLSPQMLSIAKRNLKDQNIKLKKGDFRKLSNIWKTKFDLIICMTTSFPHMVNDQNAIIALKSMYNQLNKNGVLVIDNGISDSLLDKKPRFIPAKILQNKAMYFFLEYPNANKVIFNILFLKKTKNGFEHKYDSMIYNAINKLVMDKYFSRTGFSKIEYFGDRNFSKYSKRNSKRLIVIARK